MIDVFGSAKKKQEQTDRLAIDALQNVPASERISRPSWREALSADGIDLEQAEFVTHVGPVRLMSDAGPAHNHRDGRALRDSVTFLDRNGAFVATRQGRFALVHERYSTGVQVFAHDLADVRRIGPGGSFEVFFRPGDRTWLLLDEHGIRDWFASHAS